MKPLLTAALLSTVFAAGMAYAADPAAGPILPTMATPSTPPSEPDAAPQSGRDPSAAPAVPSTATPATTSTTPDTTNPRATEIDRRRTTYSSSRRESAMHAASLQRYALQCSDLSEQWRNASFRHQTSPALARAKRQALRGERACSSRDAATLKTGMQNLQSALRLLGEQPSI